MFDEKREGPASMDPYEGFPHADIPEVRAIANSLLRHLVKAQPDEITITPTAEEVTLLSDYTELEPFEKMYLSGVIDRFKIMAGLRIDADLPQNGTANISYWLAQLPVSVEVTMGNYGEVLAVKFK